MTLFLQLYLVDGFNPFEKYESKWEIFPRVGVKKKKIFELPPPSHLFNPKKTIHSTHLPSRSLT